MCLQRYVLTEALAQNCFARADFTCDYNALCHLFGYAQEEAEEFRKEAMFFFTVKQPVGYVVYVQFGFIFEYAVVCLHVSFFNLTLRFASNSHSSLNTVFRSKSLINPFCTVYFRTDK